MNFLSLFVSVAYAASPPTAIAPQGSVGNGSGTDLLANGSGTISGIAVKVIDLLTLLAGILAVIFLIYYGIQYITSGGSPDKAKVARAGVINAIIGIVIISATYAIIRFGLGIGSTLNSISQ